MDIKLLRKKMLQQRQKTVQIGKFTFILQRPNKIDIIKIIGKHEDDMSVNYAVLMESIVSWEGVTVGDLTKEDDQSPAPFDKGLLEMFIGDRDDIFSELSKAFGELAEEYKREEAEKKL